MMQKPTIALAAALLLGVAAAPGRAADGQASTKEAQVLSAIHQANQMEIKAGQLAQDKGTSDAVKQYGQTLVDDHQKADTKVQDLAGKLGVTLDSATASEADHKDMQKEMETMDHLKQLSGASFDTSFAKAMMSDHRKTIQKLQADQGMRPQSSEVRQLITELLPTLRQHQQTAQQLSRSAAAPAPASPAKS